MTDLFPEIIRFSASPPPLTPNQLHLMVASLDFLANHRERALAAINPEEQARADRFVNPRHSDNFRLVRGSLRLYLADYLRLPAREIQFVFNGHGKPEVDPAQNHIALQFNVSHSHQMAAFLFTLGNSIGVDIEFIKSLKDISGLAQHVCSAQEMAEFNALESHQRQDAFFRLWTRKEAFIKAEGRGLSLGLRSIYIGLDASRTVHHVQYRGRWLEGWLVQDLTCDADYKLAVAITKGAQLL